MASYNFEEQLQRKLNQRSIAPTGNAWERIAYNRQIQTKKKRKAIIYWIAAAVIIAFGSFSLLFQQKTIAIENGVVVKETPVVPQVLPQLEKEIPTAVASSGAIVKPMQPEATERVTVTGIAHSDPGPEAGPEPQKAEEVVAQLETMVQSGETIDENDVDALLRKAQKDIASERANNKQLATNSSELLDTAEKEVDRTFKDKVFDLFHKKFKTIKIALSDE